MRVKHIVAVLLVLVNKAKSGQVLRSRVINQREEWSPVHLSLGKALSIWYTSSMHCKLCLCIIKLMVMVLLVQEGRHWARQLQKALISSKSRTAPFRVGFPASSWAARRHRSSSHSVASSKNDYFCGLSTIL